MECVKGVEVERWKGPHHVSNRVKEDLAVSYFPRLRGVDDDVDNLLHLVSDHHYLHTRLLDQVALLPELGAGISLNRTRLLTRVAVTGDGGGDRRSTRFNMDSY